MPMSTLARTPHHIPRANFLFRSAFALRPAHTLRDNQGLTKRVSMPIGTRTWLERHKGAYRASRRVRLERTVDAYGASETFFRSYL